MPRPSLPLLAVVSLASACSLVVGISDIVPADGGPDASEPDAHAHDAGTRRDAGARDAGHPHDGTVVQDGADAVSPGDGGSPPDTTAPSSDASASIACDAAATFGGTAVTTLVCGLNAPTAIAVSGGYVFWGDDSLGLGVLVNGKVYRRGSSGGEVAAVAASDRSVFWVANGTGIGTSLDGGMGVDLAVPNHATQVAADDDLVCWTAVNATTLVCDAPPPPDGSVAATETSFKVSGNARGIAISGAQLAVMSIDTLNGSLPAIGVFSGPSFASQCALSLPPGAVPGPIVLAGDSVYWIDLGQSPETISMLPPQLCQTDGGVFVASAAGETLVATATNLYWAIDGGIMRTALGAAAPRVFVSSLPGTPQQLATDGVGEIYWTEGTTPGSGAIRRAHE